MRKKLIAGNWKMNKTPKEAAEFIEMIKPLVKGAKDDVLVCVPFVDIPAVIESAKGTNIYVGAQNVHWEDKGAYTGEISAEMLYELGVEYVIIGHSERRQIFGEPDEMINAKIVKALEYEITPIVCCGETLEQRENDETFDLIAEQIYNAYQNISAEDVARTVIAYEPIWAIGTGKVATKEQAEEACSYVRECIRSLYDDQTADDLTILYGGSVTSESAADLFSMDNVDGGLVGGASLKEDFAKIVNYK